MYCQHQLVARRLFSVYLEGWLEIVCYIALSCKPNSIGVHDNSPTLNKRTADHTCSAKNTYTQAHTDWKIDLKLFFT